MHSPSSFQHHKNVWSNDLVPFHIVVKQTDLHIQTRKQFKNEAMKSVLKHRGILERYIMRHPIFLTLLKPYQVEENAPAIIKEMCKAGQIAGTGPMAAVAGAMAEAVGKDLESFSPDVIVENGGDIYIRTLRPRLVGIYAGPSPFTGKLALEINPNDTPIGVCTSSAIIGPSLSLGYADAVTVVSPSTALADAMATAIGNMITDEDNVDNIIAESQNIDGIDGVVIIKGEKIGAWGKIKIVPIN